MILAAPCGAHHRGPESSTGTDEGASTQRRRISAVKVFQIQPVRALRKPIGPRMPSPLTGPRSPAPQKSPLFALPLKAPAPRGDVLPLGAPGTARTVEPWTRFPLGTVHVAGREPGARPTGEQGRARAVMTTAGATRFPSARSNNGALALCLGNMGGPACMMNSHPPLSSAHAHRCEGRSSEDSLFARF
jgi:hypothetical protein